MVIGIFLALGAALCSSVGYTAIKKGLETADYKIFILLGTFTGVLISSSLLWSVGGGLSGLSLKAIAPFLITGGLGGGLLTRVAGTRAVDEIGASRTHALNSASPIVTAIVGMILLNEVIDIQLATGMVVIVIGGGFLSYLIYQNNPNNSETEQKRQLLGLAFAFYSMIMYGFSPVLRKIGLEFGATPLQGYFIRFATGFAIYIAYLVGSRTPVKINRNQQLVYYLLASVTWAIAPIASIYTLQFIPPAVFASLMRVGPLFTVMMIYLFLKGIEETNWHIGLSATLIVIGAILVSTA